MSRNPDGLIRMDNISTAVMNSKGEQPHPCRVPLLIPSLLLVPWHTAVELLFPLYTIFIMFLNFFKIQSVCRMKGRSIQNQRLYRNPRIEYSRLHEIFHYIPADLICLMMLWMELPFKIPDCVSLIIDEISVFNIAAISPETILECVKKCDGVSR